MLKGGGASRRTVLLPLLCHILARLTGKVLGGAGHPYLEAAALALGEAVAPHRHLVFRAAVGKVSTDVEGGLAPRLFLPLRAPGDEAPKGALLGVKTSIIMLSLFRPLCGRSWGQKVPVGIVLGCKVPR